MSRKNNLKKLLSSNKKERYRSYKRKKTWMYTTITGIASILGGGGIAVPLVRAETTSTTDSHAKEIDSSKLLVNQSKTTILSTPTNIIPYNQDYNKLSISKGSSLEEAKAAEVSRFIYGNFAAWQEYKWNDVPGITYTETSTAGAKFKAGVAASNLNLYVTGSGTIKWTVDLMPYTNYTFKMDHLSESKINTNTKVTINSGASQIPIESTSFQTGEGGSNGKVSVTLTLSNDFRFNDRYVGDFYFEATTPVISSTSDAPSDVDITGNTGKKLSEVLKDNIPEYYDSANQNTSIDPEVLKDPTITGPGDYQYIYKLSKWGESETQTITVHVHLDSDSISDSESTSDSISDSESTSDSDSVSDSESMSDASTSDSVSDSDSISDSESMSDASTSDSVSDS
ncbi:TPA: KxYKxGKxW signal peptide domain-containing protein, partial [Enterococcus faecium]